MNREKITGKGIMSERDRQLFEKRLAYGKGVLTEYDRKILEDNIKDNKKRKVKSKKFGK